MTIALAEGGALESCGRPELAGLTSMLIFWPWISAEYWNKISTVPSGFLSISTP